MRYSKHTITWLLILMALHGMGQAVLPDISVRNERGRIIISWLNDYKLPINHIHIQRSFDSLRHYSTIGSVLNPGNLENGYPDENPPYVRMYYRVLVSFENGEYLISRAFRSPAVKKANPFRYFWEIPALPDPVILKDPLEKKITINNKPDSLPTAIKLIPTVDSILTIPRNVFLNKNENVEIHLSDARIRKFRIRFIDINGKTVIEINDPKEETFFLEKVNFVRSGIYTYEIIENGEIFEKGQIEIPKDIKRTAENKPK